LNLAPAPSDDNAFSCHDFSELPECEVFSMRMLSSRWPLKSREHASLEEIGRLPLHVKDVSRVGLSEKLKQIRTLEAKARSSCKWSTAFDLILKFIAGLPSNPKLPGRTAQLCELSQSDLEILLDKGLLEVAPDDGTPRLFDLRLFSVTEKWSAVENGNTRRRFIAHTPGSNAAAREFLDDLQERFDFQLPSLFECVTDAATSEFAQCDLAWCYGGFLLEPHLRFWCLRIPDGRIVRLTTIPTGASWCPLLAHIFTDCMACFCAKRSTRVHTYIDNVKFLSDHREDVVNAAKFFFALAQLFRVDINESLCDTLAQRCIGTFLGVVFNHADHHANFSEKLVRKLTVIAQQTYDDFRGMTMRQLVSSWGVLTHASQISGSTRGKYYYFLKFLRRRAHERWALDAPGNFWPSLGDLPATWAQDELRSQRRDFKCLTDEAARRSQHITVFSDATLQGYGITVFFPDGTQSVVAGRWTVHDGPPCEHINEREARAVLRALDVVQSEFRRRRSLGDSAVGISLFVDNTSVIFCLGKTSSRSFFLNNIICRIRDHPQWASVVRVEYVRSQENPADWLSRLRTVPPISMVVASAIAMPEEYWKRNLEAHAVLE
jgi:hypothetical protein